MDDEKLCKGSSIQSNVKALNESVKGKHSQKRMRDESADASSDQDVHISDKKDQKRNRLLDAQGGKSQIVKRTSESQESHVQNKANEFVRTMSDDGNEIFRRAKRRIPVIQRSLAIVLASLLGVQIIIELKNDSEVTGTVDETDASMNVTLIDVRKVSPTGEVIESEILFLQGSTIRYVHIPPEYGIGEHLTHYMKTIERLSVKSAHKIKP